MHSYLYVVLLFFFLMIPLPLRSTLFPYTTLFRSADHQYWLTGTGDLAEECKRLTWIAKVVLEFRKPRTFVELLFRSEEHTSELQSLTNLVCRLLLEKKKKKKKRKIQ